MTGTGDAAPARFCIRAAALILCAMLACGAARAEPDLTPHPGTTTEADEVAGLPAPSGPLRIADARLEPLAWSDLDGWRNDDHAAAFAAFLISCRALVAGQKTVRDPRPLYAALVSVCTRALAAVPLESDAARQFFEDNFRAVRIAKVEDETGLLTGYYEPVVDGSRFPTRDFTVPLYRRPPDIVNFGRKSRKEIFPTKGRVARRIARGKYVPYFDRAQIEDGALEGRHLEICYLKSWTDVLFMQIQGSARIRLEDGAVLRVNYDAHNGLPRTSIGRLLIERNLIARDVMSMDRIREWMAANPDEANELRRQDKAFVFFRIIGLSEFDEAAGAQGVPLTPVRSIAVDRAIHVFGTPFFIDATLPIGSDAPVTPFRRLMIAQDTGGAITGPARADIFFGAGDEAGHVAGRIKQQGRFVMLVPRELDLVEAGKAMPLPPERPPEAAMETLPASQPLEGPVPVPQPKPKS